MARATLGRLRLLISSAILVLYYCPFRVGVERRQIVQKLSSLDQEMFRKQRQTLKQRIEELRRLVTEHHQEKPGVALETSREIQRSLEALHVAEEELHQQSEELLLSRQTIEAECQRYQDLFAFAPDGYVVTDTAGVIREVNRAATALFNVSPQLSVGKPLTIFLAQEQHAGFCNLLQRLSREEQTSAWETYAQPRSREPVPVSIKGVPIHDPHGAISGFRWLFRDITEQVHARQQLQTLNAELEAHMQQRAAELLRSNNELRQFAYIVSHDLQEPLRMISTYVQLLAERYKHHLDSQADEFIDFVVEGATRMQQLIRDLLNYSRIETQSKAITKTDCEQVLAHTLTTLRVAISASGALVTHDPLPTVDADSRQLSQVFQNLLSNAIKFRGGQPLRVHIAATREDNEWVFSVRDNGIGIDPQFAERIFVIFQRLHTRTEYPGTGIGLAICKRIIERHGGRMWVTSTLGEGATFYFTLPCSLP